MQTFLYKMKHASIAILLVIAMPVFAESAPVYDADAMPQFEPVADEQTQDLPPPPPPGQEGAFVPSQLPSAGSSNVSNMSMEQRIRRVEQQVTNMQSNESTARIDSLQNQVQSLRGQLEQLTRQLQQMESQQKNLYSDLDKRLNQQSATKVASAPAPSTATPDLNSMPTGLPSDDQNVTSPKGRRSAKIAMKPAPATEATVAETSAPKAPGDQPNVAEEQQIYQTAYNLIKAKKYDEAVDTLQGMLKKYPSGQFASNAHYWLGELYGLMGKNDKALGEFDTVLNTYPDSPRIPVAQLKVGLIYASQSNWSNAKNAFKKVINRYPGTASARLAAEHLKQIKQAGN